MGDQYDSEIEGVEGEEEQPIEGGYVEDPQLVAEGGYEGYVDPALVPEGEAERWGGAYGGDVQGGGGYGEYVAAEGQADAGEADAPYPRTASLQPMFEGEDVAGDPTNPNAWEQMGAARTETYYASEEERQRYELEAGEGGMARSGEAFDTTSAQAGQWAGSKDGRETFVMDNQGQFYAADQRAEMAELDDNQRFHHSSFLAGEDVGGAGEIQAREGTVEVISDRSGHYRPDMETTGQVITALEDQGQTAEAIGVELGDKGVGYEGEVQAGAIEVQAYHSDSPDVVASGLTPEQLLRERHAQKGDVLDELTAKMAGRRAELDAAAEGREINSGDVRDELVGRTAGLREGLDAEAEQRALDVAERQRAIDAEKAAREQEAGREERERANVAAGLTPDGYTQ